VWGGLPKTQGFARIFATGGGALEAMVEDGIAHPSHNARGDNMML